MGTFAHAGDAANIAFGFELIVMTSESLVPLQNEFAFAEAKMVTVPFAVSFGPGMYVALAAESFGVNVPSPVVPQ